MPRGARQSTAERIGAEMLIHYLSGHFDLFAQRVHSEARHRNIRVMSARHKTRFLLLALISFVGVGQIASAELIYSKARRFRIPFQFDQSELARIGAKELRLFVSQDNRQWQVAESAALTETRFNFEAPDDGIYWFSVKSRVASGADYPPGPHQASLNVLVDTEAPKLELQVVEVEPGRVRLSWNAEDRALDSNSLQLEHMEPGSNLWQTVVIRSQERGQTSWTTELTGPIQVRGRVADLAGNVTTATAEVVISGRPNRENEKPDAGKPVAVHPKMIEPSDRPTVPASTASSPVLNPTPQFISAKGNGVAITTSSQPPLANRPDVATPALPAGANASAPSSPPKPNARYMNSLMFRIAYSLQEVGPSGVSQVDLYITENRGQQWFHYGVDPDRVSPMEVTVPHDGEYGFAFRVTNGQGRVATPPQPGDVPDVSIVVDRTAPVVKLNPLRYDEQAEHNQVLISWTTQDNDLADRSISLYYSITAKGPWIPLQNWSPNSGQMVWSVPATLDQPIFVRLDARDFAGNVSSVYTDTPFLIDRSHPRAKVTEIESLDSSPR